MRRLVFSDRAKADLERLDRPVRLRLLAAINRFLHSHAGDVKKLQGVNPTEYRLRVGDWRVRFSYPAPDLLQVERVLNRKDAYR